MSEYQIALTPETVSLTIGAVVALASLFVIVCLIVMRLDRG